jgi:hypothetical protein
MAINFEFSGMYFKRVVVKFPVPGPYSNISLLLGKGTFSKTFSTPNREVGVTDAT